MPSVSTTKKLVVGGLSVATVSTFAYLLYTQLKKRKRRSEEGESEEELEPSTSSSRLQEDADTMQVQRGGRRNYRAEAREQRQQKDSGRKPEAEAEPRSLFDVPQEPLDWSEETEKRLAEELEAKCATSDDQRSEGEEVERVFAAGRTSLPPQEPLSLSLGLPHQSTVLKQPLPVESPSMNSEISQDSGRGGTVGSSTSPSREVDLPMYEIEIPQDIVGLIVGKKGCVIKDIQQHSGAHIMIRHHFDYREGYRLCTIEGTRQQINTCLRILRRRFPPSKFPHFNLKPVVFPPATPPAPSPFEPLSYLELPDGVKVDVFVCNIVDVSHFFVQQPTHPSYPSLATLDYYMGALYNQALEIPAVPKPVEIGILCAVPVPPNWFRATTWHVYETGDVLVKFLDHGGYMRVPADDLRAIRSDFMSLPFQATECYLANVEPTSDEGFPPEASKIFSDMTTTSAMEVVAVGKSSDDVPLVEIYKPGYDKSINEVLVEMGHAKWIEPKEGEAKSAA